MIRLFCHNYTNADIAHLYHIIESVMQNESSDSELGKDLSKLFTFVSGVIEGRLSNDSK